MIKRFVLAALMLAPACSNSQPAIVAPLAPANAEPPRSNAIDSPPPALADPAHAQRSDTRGPTREEKLKELALQVAKNPGWTLHETAHYFIVTSVDDAAFLDELRQRCERIRVAIEADFPDPRASSDRVNSAPSVLRVCKDRDQFANYGGAAQSTGYWSWVDGEIVLYDDRAGGGRRDTWATLNAMVFMEYLSEVSSNSGAAPWLLYGLADYYSGFELVHDAWSARPFAWRERTAQENIRTSKVLPLEKFVRLNQRDYFAAGDQNYAQGWSLIWFLRQGTSRSKHWNAAWNQILDTWWKTWLDTHDLDVATDRAFTGVDWKELESAWASFILVGE
jgi:hypothetical protein